MLLKLLLFFMIIERYKICRKMPLSITHRRGVVGEAGAAIVVAAEKK